MKRMTIGLVLFLVGGLLLPIGCKTTNKKDNKKSGKKKVKASRESFVYANNDDLQIDDKLLLDHSFEKVWDLPIKANNQYDTIEQMYLVGDSIYVYAKNERFLHRIDRRSGTVKWSFRMVKGLKFRPTLHEYSKEEQKLTGISRPDELIVMSKERLYCLDKEYGIELWSVDLGEISPSAPAGVHKNHVYICGWDDRLYAFSKDTQVESWRFRADDDIRAAPVGAPPESKKDIVFFASTDGNVYALNSHNGSPSWKPFRTFRRILVPPVYYKTWVYVGSTDYKLYCLRSDNGSMKWEHIGESPIVTPPVPIRTRVYTIAKDRYLHSLHYSTGKLMWKYPSASDTLILTNGDILSGKILSDSDFTDELEFRLTSGKKLSIDKSSIKNINYNAHRVNRLEAPRRVLAKGKDNLFILNNNRELCALDEKTGVLLWKIKAESIDYFVTNTADYRKLSERPDAGTIYLGFKNGWIVAIRERDKF